MTQCGTPMYMSPEVFQGIPMLAPRVTRNIDTFSLLRNVN